jgi:hypothetical protein
MVEKTNWFTGLAIVFILIGLFTATRVLVNFGMYQQYPSYGALPFTLSSIPVYTQTEADCQSTLSYPLPPGDPAASDPEFQAKQAAYDKEVCFRSVNQERERVKYVDMTLAGFFTFLGLGMFLSRKFLPKIF